MKCLVPAYFLSLPCTVQHGLSDHGFSDNTGHPTFFAWSRQNPIYPMYFTTVYPTFYHGLSDNTGHPTFFAGPKRSFTTDYPTFFITARESREKINIYTRALNRMITVHSYVAFFFVVASNSSKLYKKVVFVMSKTFIQTII